jgi:hypothetical protein
MNLLQQALAQLNIRHDAKYTAILDQQLEHLRAQTYDKKYPMLKARSLIPVDNSVNPGADSVAYYQWDQYGMADIISNHADDLPKVGALAEKFVSPVVSLGDAFSYSVQDLRAATMSGNRLDERKAVAARDGVEQRIDELAAKGNALHKLYGFVNHPNVTVIAAETDGTSTEWIRSGSVKSPANIQKDIRAMISEVWTATKQVHSVNTLVLPPAEYSHIAETPVGTDNQLSILKNLLSNSPQITSVDYWHKLETADAAGTGPRAIAYEKDPMVLQLVIPQEFEMFPPQARNLAFEVPAHARYGGVQIYYPLAIVYMDDI